MSKMLRKYYKNSKKYFKKAVSDVKTAKELA